MAKKMMAIPLTLAVVLGVQTAGFAQQQPMMDQQRTGADAIRMNESVRVADLPAGHWATSATQVAVANNILSLENGQFNGEQRLTRDQLRQAMESLVNTAENVAAQGALPELRAAIGVLPTGSQPITRLELSQALARFLDAANRQELVAVGAPRNEAHRYTDLSQVPPAVASVVNRYKVMTGFPDNTFRPNQAVTRYQMAAIASHILRDMAEAPIAQAPQPQQPPIVVQPAEPQPPSIVVVPGEEPDVIAVEPEMPAELNHRERIPVHIGWQALNTNNLGIGGISGLPNTQFGQGQGGAFNVIPGSLTLTGYQGPVMLQMANNFLVDLYQSNSLNSELRLGYSDLKYGMVQLIPFVGATLGANVAPGYNYTGYTGVNYGGILSLMPMDNLEIFGSFSQTALLGAGRYNSNFQPINYPNAMGAAVSNYGLGADFYVSPNIALTLGVNTFQLPAQFASAGNLQAGGVNNVFGGNIGVGFGF